MSYQIKRTPYFRRIFNNSRRNGQLQRLREEYERIQEFNDRTIDLKMRQVRLKRLFREIEDINESPSTSNAQHHHSTLVPVSPEVLQAQHRRERLEALERARELGQEISRRNAQLAESGSGHYLRSELRLNVKMQVVYDARREAQERRQRAARRISYGNAQSRSNIERILQRRQRRLVTDETPSTTLIVDARHQVAQLSQVSQLPQSQLSYNQLHPDLMKRAMLQHRLQYGNSRSSNNMLRSRLAATHRVLDSMSATVEIDQQQREELQQDNQQLLEQQLEQHQEQEERQRQQQHNCRIHCHQRQLVSPLPQHMQHSRVERKPLDIAQFSPSCSSLITYINGDNNHTNSNNVLIIGNDYNNKHNDNNTLCNNDHSNNKNSSNGNGNIDSNNIDDAAINDNSNGKQQVTDSEVEMHSAMLPPTELEQMLRSSPGSIDHNKNNYSSSHAEVNNIGNSDLTAYDDIPTTSHKAYSSAEEAFICQYNPLAGSCSMAESSGRRTAVQRWQQVSLTLPWIKVMQDRSHPNELPTQSLQPPNMGLAFGGNELGTNSSDRSNTNSNMNYLSSNHNNNNDHYANATTSVTATDNYHSIRGPSLMQEDLIQVMELDNNGEMPTIHIAHRSYSQQ